jgi:hypothetical protein
MLWVHLPLGRQAGERQEVRHDLRPVDAGKLGDFPGADRSSALTVQPGRRKLHIGIQDDPNFPDAYRLLAACYAHCAHMGRLDEAQEVFSRLRAITPLVVPLVGHLPSAAERCPAPALPLGPAPRGQRGRRLRENVMGAESEIMIQAQRVRVPWLRRCDRQARDKGSGREGSSWGEKGPRRVGGGPTRARGTACASYLGAETARLSWGGIQLQNMVQSEKGERWGTIGQE